MSNTLLYRGNPCKECEDRHEGCHGECERYKAWRDEVDKKKSEIYHAKKAEVLSTQFTLDEIYKHKARENKRKKRGFN